MTCYEGGGGGGRRRRGTRGGDGPPAQPSSCEALDFNTALASPDPKLLAQVKADWVLDVATRSVAATKVAVVLFQGQVLGTITSPEAVQLVDCIEKGFKYRAHVQEIKGGLCRVRVRYSP